MPVRGDLIVCWNLNADDVGTRFAWVATNNCDLGALGQQRWRGTPFEAIRVGDDHVISQSRRRCNRQGPRDQSEYASCGLLHRKLILESEILTGKNERPKLYALSDPKHAAAILPTGLKRSAIFAPRIAIRFASILYSLRPILSVCRSKPC